jgi:KDO2-lipid IV(A) lauroyltransferase
MKKYYRHLSHYLLESIFSYFGDKNKVIQKVKISQNHSMEQAYQNGENIIIMSGHYGNWELISMVLPIVLDKKVIGIYKKLSSIFFNQLIKEQRSRFGLQLVEMKEVSKLYGNQVEKPFITLFIADQSPSISEKGEVVRFLGSPTLFYEGAAVLKKRYGMKIFYQHVNVIDGVYYISFIELGENVIQDFATCLEKDILKRPELWLWSHNRWKHKLD